MSYVSNDVSRKQTHFDKTIIDSALMVDRIGITSGIWQLRGNGGRACSTR